MIGTAAGAWWWARQRRLQMAAEHLTPARDHGTVIFRNTPTPVEGDVL